MLRIFYVYLQRELEEWIEDDVEFQPDLPPNADAGQKASRFRSGLFYFPFPGHEDTTVTLKVPSSRSYAEAEWIITAPNSVYHPGRHTGRLVFPSDFPTRRPYIVWDSPILSAFVKKGRVSVGYVWRRQKLKVVLQSLAAVVIFGPELQITTDPNAPEPQYRCHSQYGSNERMPILQKSKGWNDTDKEWMMRVTNFFSRVYNRIDDDGEVGESREITGIERDTPLTAIADFQKHIGINRALTRDPVVIFKQVTTLRELQREERVWANELNDASSGMATQGWGKAETFEERDQRVAR
jgi:ubiquitin-protein ligase